ncbi:MAG: molybdopterin-dependent oxidoreductase [Chloroflexia bacterium]
MSRPVTQEVRLHKGFGAGVGAALVMIIGMELVRYTLTVQSIPELLQGVLLRLVSGDMFEFMVQHLGAGAKVLLLVSVFEGILLAGGVLGWLFVRLWRPAAPDANSVRRMWNGRYLAGAVYGLLVGIGLLAAFYILYLLALYNPQPATDRLLAINLMLLFLGLIFGLSLASLLPWPVGATPVVEPAPDADGGRRGFLRVAGGTLLALIGGAGLWGVLANVLAEPTGPGVIQALPPGTPHSVSGADATQTAGTENDIATAVANSGGSLDPTNTAAGASANTAVPATTPAAGQTPAAADTAAPAGTPAAADTAAPAGTPAAANTAAPAGTAATAPTAVAAAPNATAFPAVPILVPEITPVSNFYITTKNITDPSVDAAKWSLSILGMVENPATYTIDQIKAMPKIKVIHTLECISNTVGGPLIGNARWAGVHLADLVTKARPKSGVMDVVFRAADDYSDSVPLSVVMDKDAMLVYEMNGDLLQVKHGFPARLLIPNIFGMKNVKWITGIEFVGYDYKGYWQSQGWSDPAPYLTMSRIDYPSDGSMVKSGPLYVGGIAFAGNRGIKKVEVSTNGGKTWGDAQLRRPLGRNTWVLWTYPWVAASGDTTLVVRATDGTGKLQNPADVNNYPNGADGYHKVAVKVG